MHCSGQRRIDRVSQGIAARPGSFAHDPGSGPRVAYGVGAWLFLRALSSGFRACYSNCYLEGHQRIR